MSERTYLCIDMKCFFASVECAERGLNPFETELVVADESRGKGALCLAISPKMKSLGVKNRCRIFEIPQNINFIIAKPRMKKYIEYAADIYETYLDYVSSEDIHVYSIDEAFIDATDYLHIYKKTPKEFAKFLIDEIAKRTHIPATAGIGTNLYLAKIALDITAKRCADHMGYLSEELYKDTLWKHQPLTDFWNVGSGIAARLYKYGIVDMEGIANTPEKLLYKIFGINAELLIDHAWGKESCTMADIKAYKSKSKSISNSQILMEDYDYEKAALVMCEMTLSACQMLISKRLIANSIAIGVGYSKELAESTGGSMRLEKATNLFSVMKEYAMRIFEQTTLRKIPIRRLSISLGGVCDEGCEGYDFFTDFDKIDKERKVERTVLDIKSKFGKNSLLRGMDLEDGATASVRNKQIGGHNSE